MGYIDKLTVKIRCPKCGVFEEEVAKDSGSGWSGPCWSRLGRFVEFSIKQTHHEKHGPHVESAICKTCGIEAEVSSNYTQ